MYIIHEKAACKSLTPWRTLIIFTVKEIEQVKHNHFPDYSAVQLYYFVVI